MGMAVVRFLNLQAGINSMVNENTDDLLVGPEIDSNIQVMLQKELAPLFVDPYITQFTVSRYLMDRFASGNASVKGSSGFGWIAKKNNGEWKFVLKSQEAPTCSVLREYDVPNTFYSGYCWEEDGHTKRVWGTDLLFKEFFRSSFKYPVGYSQDERYKIVESKKTDDSNRKAIWTILKDDRVLFSISIYDLQYKDQILTDSGLNPSDLEDVKIGNALGKKISGKLIMLIWEKDLYLVESDFAAVGVDEYREYRTILNSLFFSP